VHISKLSRQRISQVTDVLKEGMPIPVKLLEIDKQGRLNLSYIDAIDPGGVSEVSEVRRDRPPRDRPPRNGHSRNGPRR
jgi:polyribonucleotide nucleotidyltransferase